jgi:hypothetical protein
MDQYVQPGRLKIINAQNAIQTSQFNYCFNSCANITNKDINSTEVNCFKNCKEVYNKLLEQYSLK